MLRIHVNLSKGQTREMPEIEHARSNLAKKIKDSGIYQYIVRYGRIANKYFRKFTASSICCIALLNFLILTNWYYLWHCVYVCYTLRTIQGALHSYKVQSYVQPAACLSMWSGSRFIYWYNRVLNCFLFMPIMYIFFVHWCPVIWHKAIIKIIKQSFFVLSFLWKHEISSLSALHFPLYFEWVWLASSLKVDLSSDISISHLITPKLLLMDW